MRVLWFVEKPLPAVTDRLGRGPIHHASWLDQLEVTLRGAAGLELGIAAPTAWADTPYEPFESNGVHYFGIAAKEPDSAGRRIADRWLSLCRATTDVESCLPSIESFAPDVIHVHGTENPYGLLAGRTGTPVVVSLQGILSVYSLLEGRGLDRSMVLSLSPWLFLRGTGTLLHGLSLRTRAERERLIFATCRHFIGRTDFDADVVRVLSPDAHYYHCDEPLRPEFRQAEWSRDASDHRAVFCTGGSYARKGMGTLLRAIASLADGRMPEVTLRLAGLSPSDGEDGRALWRETRRLGLSRRVTFLGRLDGPALCAELVRAGVFVLPTHADNSPNGLAEAMTVGTPSVASAAGGIPSLARDGLEALLVQDGDHFSLAGAIARVLQDAELSRALSVGARTAALRRHDPAGIRTQVLAAYESVCAEAGGPTPRPPAIGEGVKTGAT